MSARATEQVRLIADSMLGKLAKTLRMLGFDAAYDPFIEDRELVRRARAENRIVLTRDTQLLRRRDLPRFVFVERDHLREQLAQVVRELALEVKGDAAFTRCLVCNGELMPVAKESVRREVPMYVYQTQGAFVRCPECARVFWRGTHVEGMERKLAELGLKP